MTLTLVEEVQRYLAAVDTIREEVDPDFLRYGSARDKARQERGDQGTLVARVKAAAGSYPKLRKK